MHKTDFDSIYLLITNLLWSNSLLMKKNCQIVLTLLVNEKYRNHFLKDNCFSLTICKYISTIVTQKMEALVTHKVLKLPISKINMETLKKFDTLSIVQY